MQSQRAPRRPRVTLAEVRPRRGRVGALRRDADGWGLAAVAAGGCLYAVGGEGAGGAAAAVERYLPGADTCAGRPRSRRAPRAQHLAKLGAERVRDALPLDCRERFFLSRPRCHWDPRRDPGRGRPQAGRGPAAKTRTR